VERYSVSPLAWMQGRLGMVESWRGRYERVAPPIERCLEIARGRQHFEPMAWVTGGLVERATHTGVTDQVLVHAQRGLEFGPGWNRCRPRATDSA
jgi:hypothetical protein